MSSVSEPIRVNLSFDVKIDSKESKRYCWVQISTVSFSQAHRQVHQAVEEQSI